MFKKTLALALVVMSLGPISVSTYSFADDRDGGRRFDDHDRGPGRDGDRGGRDGGRRWGGGRRDNPNWGDRRRIDRQYIRQLAGDLEQQSANLQTDVARLPGFTNLDRDAQLLSSSARSFRDVVLDNSRPRDLMMAFRYVEDDFKSLYINFLRAMNNRSDEPQYYQTLRTFADVGEIYATLKNELNLSDDDQPLPPPRPPNPPPRPPNPPPPPPPPMNQPIYVSEISELVTCGPRDSVDLTVRRSGLYRVDWSFTAGEAYNFAIPTYIITNKTRGTAVLSQAAAPDARHGANASGAPLVTLEAGQVYNFQQFIKMRFCSGDSFNRRAPIRSMMRVIFDRDGR